MVYNIIMPRCMVPGCTSGYDSNKEKVHNFYVPKDKNIANLWQAAIKRKDLMLKSSEAIYEKHFLFSDIQWYREICDDRGNVLGTSARYKIPRLCKGVVPSQFPWTEITENTEKENMNEEECEQLVSLSPPKTNEASLSLDEIINAVNTDLLFIPAQWLYTQCYVDEKRLLVFFLPKCRRVKNVSEGYTIDCIKEVIVDETMMLRVNLLQQLISDLSRYFEGNNNIETIMQLGMWLESVSLIEICPGINDDEITSKYGLHFYFPRYYLYKETKIVS